MLLKKEQERETRRQSQEGSEEPDLFRTWTSEWVFSRDLPACGLNTQNHVFLPKVVIPGSRVASRQASPDHNIGLKATRRDWPSVSFSPASS